MSAPRAGFCVACARYAGARADTCPFCGETVCQAPGWRMLRHAAPFAAGSALGLAALSHGAAVETVWARIRMAGRTPTGGVLLALAAGLSLLPPRPLGGPAYTTDAAPTCGWRSLGNLALGAACACWGALVPGPPEVVYWCAMAMALAALAWLPHLQALNYAALSPLLLVPAARWIGVLPGG